MRYHKYTALDPETGDFFSFTTETRLKNFVWLYDRLEGRLHLNFQERANDPIYAVKYSFGPRGGIHLSYLPHNH